MQEHLFEYFKSERHSGCLGNVFITLIDKVDGKLDLSYIHTNWKNTNKLSLICVKSILKISQIIYL